jgi:DNA-entry nuclease
MDRIKRAGAFFSIIVMCILFCGCDMQEVQGTLSEITDKDTWMTTSVATTEKIIEEDTIYDIAVPEDDTTSDEKKDETETIQIPAYSGKLSVIVNNNVPDLDKKDAEKGTFINLSELDDIGRCGTAYMCAGPETLATEDRGEIGHVKPSGWHTAKYPDVIPDRYLYNRSHLLMYALSGLNDDERNLITGTRQLNADRFAGMLHYENIVLDYIKETGNHVLYRVTPVFSGNNLLADGVLMEALSVENNDVSFCVFVYNVQDGVNIDYATGESNLAE